IYENSFGNRYLLIRGKHIGHSDPKSPKIEQFSTFRFDFLPTILISHGNGSSLRGCASTRRTKDALSPPKGSFRHQRIKTCATTGKSQRMQKEPARRAIKNRRSSLVRRGLRYRRAALLPTCGRRQPHLPRQLLRCLPQRLPTKRRSVQAQPLPAHRLPHASAANG